MAIVINGSGTVTGLSVGGLPDGTVDSDTLANNAVVTGKIADGSIVNADVNASAAIASSKLVIPAVPAGTAMFRATGSSSGGGWSSESSNTKLVFAGEFSDPDNCYNTSTGYFTAPEAGTYFFYMNIYTCQFDASAGFSFRLNDSQSNTTDRQGHATYTDNNTDTDMFVSAQMVIPLSANDTISVYTSTSSDWYSGHSYWGGFRLK